jgi:hypothetical protein
MRSTLLRADPLTRFDHTLHEEDDGRFIFESRQDVQPLVERNRALYADTDHRARWGNEPMHWVGAIPPLIYADLQRQGIAADPEALKRWLMDPDHSAWLIRPGRL